MTTEDRGRIIISIMKEKEYRKLKTQIEAEYHRKIEALETVWQMSGEDATKAGNQPEKRFGKGSLLKAVRRALEQVKGEFTLRDIQEKIGLADSAFAATVKPASLSSTLKRLETDHELEIVERGRGKRASKYRKLSVTTH